MYFLNCPESHQYIKLQHRHPLIITYNYVISLINCYLPHLNTRQADNKPGHTDIVTASLFKRLCLSYEPYFFCSAMSHHHNDGYICPNCGFATSHNYCARCGQEVHLHKDSFGGLILHFIGHYFHYDSKFWQTLKTLVLSPGQLTLAYWQRQRARYISPISLYIFVSAMFFICMSLSPRHFLHGEKGSIAWGQAPKGYEHANHDTVRPPDGSIEVHNRYDPEKDKGSLKEYIVNRMNKLEEEKGDNAAEYVVEKIYHTIPKVFFFMIPLMALMLRVLVLRRKDLLFAHHAIYSLHLHCMVFMAAILMYVPLVRDIPYLAGILLAGVLAYSTAAMHRVYGTGWVQAVLANMLMGIIYLAVLLLAIFADFLVILYLA